MHFKKVIHKGTLSLLVALHANGFTLPTQSVIEPSKVVDFATALERALQNDPYQEWVDHRIEGIQGDHLQASKRPNPVIGIEIGNLLGSGSYRRTESSEVTLSLSQVIETAGKRKLRVQQAAASQNELLWERAHQRLQKEAQVRAAFIETRIAHPPRYSGTLPMVRAHPERSIKLKRVLKIKFEIINGRDRHDHRGHARRDHTHPYKSHPPRL